MARTKVTEPPKMELDLYISHYRGHTRFDRLYHIGTTSTHLAHEALKQAVREAKGGSDVERYHKAVTAFAEVAPTDPEAVLDQDWIARTELAVKKETARLEQELKGYKNNLIKESIRMGYDDLGRHYYETGNMAEAVKAYQKEREFCTSPAHISLMNFRLINVYLHQGSWHSVEVSAQRLNNMSSKKDKKDKTDENMTQSKVLSSLGLSAMAGRRYTEAATKFLLVDPDTVYDSTTDGTGEIPYNDMVTPNDIATYGALCAMASLNREELQKLVLDSSTFRPFLELEPHLRRAISAFVSGRYSNALSILDSYRTDYLLDIHLHSHLDQLYLAIRSKALVEYFSPFSSLSFSALGSAFGATEDQVVAMAVELIKSKQLDARLDLENGLLVANTIDKRRKIQEEALQMSQEYERTTLQRLLRIEALNAGLEVRAPLRQEAFGGGATGIDPDTGGFDLPMPRGRGRGKR